MTTAPHRTPRTPRIPRTPLPACPRRPGRRPGLAHRWCVVGVLAAAILVPFVAAVPADAGDDEPSMPAPLGSGDPRQLLTATVAALEQPHVGRVSVITFSSAGPRVADLDVRVDAMGGMELRRPTRWLVGGPGEGWLRTSTGAVSATPVATGARMDVDAVLDHWDATVGPPRGLDTGPATPVHLVRRSGAAVEEVLYVDHVTALPVRRETRGADGQVLRVVAYTSLTRVDVGGPAEVQPADLAGSPGRAQLAAIVDAGYDVPRTLAAGFDLVELELGEGMAVARYGDGLSVLSVYQQHGRLDPSQLHGASVLTVAGRDVWTWPGSEPLRLVWTGEDRTWTAISDAPLPVVSDALASLPGEHVGHDTPSRIVRGLARAWDWLRGLGQDVVT